MVQILVLKTFIEWAAAVERILNMLVCGLLVTAGYSGAPARAADLDSWPEQLAASPVVAAFGFSLDQDPAPPQDLEACLVWALLHNPRLRAAGQETAAQAAAARRSGALPDPRLGWTEYLQSVETRVGPQLRAFSLSQAFPWFGTLSLQGEAARQRTGAAEAAFDKAVLDLMAAVKVAYFELGYLEGAIAVTEQHLQLLDQWEQVAQARYAAGQGPYTAVVKAQLELAVLGNRLAELGDRRHPLAANLNALLDRPADAPVPTMGRPQAVSRDLDDDSLRTRMLAENPELRAWDHRSREWEAVQRLAGKQGLPNFVLGLNYIQTGPARMAGVADSGTDAVTASVGVSLPLWRGKYHDAELEAGSRLLAVRSSRLDQANKLSAALATALFKQRDAARKLVLHDTALLPKGRQSLEAVRSAYEAGKSGFLDLIDAQRMLLEFELNRERAAADLEISQAEIERLVGGPLDSGRP